MPKEFLIFGNQIIRISSIISVAKRNNENKPEIVIEYGYVGDGECYKYDTQEKRDKDYEWILKELIPEEL